MRFADRLDDLDAVGSGIQHVPIAIEADQSFTTTGCSLEIDENSAVLGLDSKPVPGPYIAGEIVGGVHGSNRLGDHSLLDYAIFGRAARAACASHVLGDRVKVTSLAVHTDEGRAERSKSDQAIVVGGDWADNNTVLGNIGSVVLLDKSSFCGGDSTATTSGINGVNTRTQRQR